MLHPRGLPALLPRPLSSPRPRSRPSPCGSPTALLLSGEPAPSAPAHITPGCPFPTHGLRRGLQLSGREGLHGRPAVGGRAREEGGRKAALAPRVGGEAGAGPPRSAKDSPDRPGHFPRRFGPGSGDSPSAERKEDKKRSPGAGSASPVPSPQRAGALGPAPQAAPPEPPLPPQELPLPPARALPQETPAALRGPRGAPPPPVTAPPPPRSPPLADPPRKMVAFAPPRGCERGAVQPTPLAPPPPPLIGRGGRVAAPHWLVRTITAGRPCPLSARGGEGGEDAPHAQAAVSDRAGRGAAGRFATGSRRPLPRHRPAVCCPVPPHRPHAATVGTRPGFFPGLTGARKVSRPDSHIRRARPAVVLEGKGGEAPRRLAAAPEASRVPQRRPRARLAAPLPGRCSPAAARPPWPEEQGLQGAAARRFPSEPPGAGSRRGARGSGCQVPAGHPFWGHA